MTIKQITVHAGRTFNHPHEQYSNLKPGISIVADLAEGDDPIATSIALQQQAEKLIEDHKQGLLKSIEELYELGEVKAEFLSLDSQLKRHQARLEQIRKAHPGIAQQLSLMSGEDA